MSTTVHEGEAFSVTLFYGGAERGRCVQITTPAGRYVQLTNSDALELARVLKQHLIGPDGVEVRRG